MWQFARPDLVLTPHLLMTVRGYGVESATYFIAVGGVSKGMPLYDTVAPTIHLFASMEFHGAHKVDTKLW